MNHRNRCTTTHQSKAFGGLLKAKPSEDAGVRLGQRRAGRLRVGNRIGDMGNLRSLRRQHGRSVLPQAAREHPGERVALGIRANSAALRRRHVGSLDDAFRSATAGMAQWLGDNYKLTPSEISQVIGTAAEYKVCEVADRNSCVVLKISKDRLKTLIPATK